ncbi:MAG: MjaI family restriction endonuclease, partial [Patescibacteria group bacterium]
RPKVVGQLSELIKECHKKNFEEWKEWYLSKHPHAIDEASKKIAEMVDKLKKAIELIDDNMVKDWVEDLVLGKTFVGLRFQEAILKKVAKLKNAAYRLAKPAEESKGIDGFIGKIAVSIKPETYKTMDVLSEEIAAKIIFYKKTKAGLFVDASALFE